MGDHGKQMRFTPAARSWAARSHHALLIFLAIYAIVLLAFLNQKPLMLDEILDLIGVRDSTLPEVLNFVPTSSSWSPSRSR